MAIWDIKERNKKVRSNEIKGTRGFFSGGQDPGGTSAAIDMITFVSGGGAVDFGDITIATNQLGGGNAGSTTRGFVRFGGENASGYYETPCEVINTRGGTGTISHTFGDLTVGSSGKAVFSNQIRAVTGGGAITPNGDAQNVIDYFTIATYGNATDFGDLTVARAGSDGLASPTRGIFAGGFVGPATMKNEIDYVTIASTGNATDFGDLSEIKRQCGTGSNRTRAIIGGGQTGGSPFPTVKTMEYFTIATTGNGTDFGDLTAERQTRGVSNSVDIIFGGGSTTNILEKMTIANLANTVDFGDLTKTFNSHFAASDGHGGLPEEIINMQRPSVTYMPGSGRGIFAGGLNPGGNLSTMDLIHISTLGNASDFGDLNVSSFARGAAGAASNTRGLIAGGGDDNDEKDHVSSIEFQSLGNAADFGNLTAAAAYTCGTSSTTRSMRFGGDGAAPSGNSGVDVVDYGTIATAGNYADFGDLSVAKNGSAACASGTRAVAGGGIAGTAPDQSKLNVMEYFTIASTGDETDFGDLTVARSWMGAGSSSTRGLYVGGFAGARSDVLDYITIASAGDAQDFGDLTVAVFNTVGLSNSTRHVQALANASPGQLNTLDYVTIASTGDAADFGDLTAVKQNPSPMSDNHGGLQA